MSKVTLNSSIHFVLVGIAAFLTSCSATLMTDCSLRAEQYPEVPIYPGSTMIDETVHEEPQSSFILSTYSTEADPQNVVDFYRELTRCTGEVYQGRVKCHGKADPFGVFDVYVEFEDVGETTAYTLDVRWDKCGDFDPFVSVED